MSISNNNNGPLGSILFISLSASPFLFNRIKTFINYFLKQNSKNPKKLTNALNKSALTPEPEGSKSSTENKPELKGRPMQGVGISNISIFDIPTLRDTFPSADIQNDCGPGYNKIIGGEDFVINDIVRKANSVGVAEAFVRAGPRSLTHFDPTQVRAGIVTCGGLCPGLNNVIRELVHALTHLYGVDKIYGIK